MTIRVSISAAVWAWVLAAAVCGAGVASAQVTQDDKLTAFDGVPGDQFGFSVSISGGRAIVGSLYDDDLGADSGGAYLYNTYTGEMTFKLTPTDGGEDDFFGTSVGISDDRAIVGSWRDDENGDNAGAAYLFNVGTGEQTHKLLADDGEADDWFGRSAAISGNRAIVGTRSETSGGLNSGSAYIFDVMMGNQLLKLTPEDGLSANEFGYSVDIRGNTAIVGAFTDDEEASDAGAAYLFDVASGEQLHKLTADDADAGDWFGYSVAISNGVAIVGARGDDAKGFNAGAAYLFDVASGDQLVKLTADDGSAQDFFGYDVAISGNHAVVGALGDDDNGFTSGSAYLFDVSTHKQLDKITPDDGAANDQFGVSVGISGYSAVIGANLDDDQGDGSGSAYLFSVPALPGDADGDADIDLDDYDILSMNMYTAVAGGEAEGDFNGDGFVNFEDFVILALNFGLGGPDEIVEEQVHNLPEPATAALMGITVLALWRCRFRRHADHDPAR